MYAYLRRGYLRHLMDRGQLDAYFMGLECHSVFDHHGKQHAWQDQWRETAGRSGDKQFYVSLGDLESMQIDIPPDLRQAMADGGYAYREMPLPSTILLSERRGTPH